VHRTSLVLRGGIERLDDPTRCSPDLRALGTEDKLADVVRITDGHLAHHLTFVWSELEDQPARIAHLTQPAQELQILGLDRCEAGSRRSTVVPRCVGGVSFVSSADTNSLCRCVFGDVWLRR
jgi:hypothetical protein